jgi:hypothetical protein
LVVQLAARRSESLNSLFTTAENWGSFSTSWVKDRYYGRTHVTQSDCDRLRQLMIGASGQVPRLFSDLAIYRAAVEKMCTECAGAGGRCWDAACPLRAVSPVPLK